ncbi:MAG TPA: GNAT family N-acetyltransferase [Candidatus Acidoferrales bacterium]|nr:GNAT family N-acetyltransferase [Candidatus Acidoferrales bacterium]
MASHANPRPTVRIRVATPADIEALIGVVNPAFVVEDFIEGTRTDAAHMAETMKAGEFLLAEDHSGRAVACVYVEVQGERAYMGMLAVEPPRQGTGLGRMMVAAAEDHCRGRGCRWMDLRVLSPRAALLPFYERLGYAQVRTEEFHPPRPLRGTIECYGIIMSKKL